MRENWISILNDEDDRTVCYGPNLRLSLSKLRNLISSIQTEIIRKKHEKWVLYETDRLRFICGLFSLLLCGRDVFVPSGRHDATITSLFESHTGPPIGLIGAFSDINSDIQVIFENLPDNPATQLTVAQRWGQVTFYTSGSSGDPKPIIKTAQQLYQEAALIQAQWGFSPTTTFVPLVTHLHMYGLIFSLLLPLVARASFYVPRVEGMWTATSPINVDEAGQVDNLVVVASPTIGRHCDEITELAEPKSLVRDDRPFPVSKVYSAGGKLTIANAERMANLFGCTVTEIFGSTETGAVATRERDTQSTCHSDPLWNLLPKLNAIVSDGKTNDMLEVGMPGEFAIWGGHVGGSENAPVATGDEVSFVNSRQFKLLGRNNQICKIEGKRIALDEYIRIAEKCDFVEEAIVLPHKKNKREMLLCGVQLSETGILNYQMHGKFNTDRVIREHLLKFLSATLVPRTIRYFDNIPRNQQGKITKEMLTELLVEPQLSEFPLLKNWHVDEDRAEITIVIPVALRYLSGHFDEMPVVPGVVLLHWVYCYCNEYLHCQLNSKEVNHVKFFKPINPGAQVNLILERNANGVKFLYKDRSDVKFAAGYISYMV